MLITPEAGRERVESASLGAPAVLAVSGGADSMVMAAHLVETEPHQVVAIATFDHGTGSVASESAAMVVAWAHHRGIPVRLGAAGAVRRSEAGWRAARWAFLREVSEEFGAPIATAHTEDDQAETVFMRLLRHSGVRGLAGLLAPGPVRRPLLSVSRVAVREYADSASVAYRDDPTNTDIRFLRNRVRLELLPRLEREVPGFRAWLLALGTRAAAWRHDVAGAVDRFWAPEVQDGAARVVVGRDRARDPGHDEAALFWPEVAGRVGVALDWRGTARLASFTTKREGGLQMPLSGGVRVAAERYRWVLERPRG